MVTLDVGEHKLADGVYRNWEKSGERAFTAKDAKGAKENQEVKYQHSSGSISLGFLCVLRALCGKCFFLSSIRIED
jgi:hypothetical protein